MKKYLMTFFFILAICIVNSSDTGLLANESTEKTQDILTQKQAAALASKIANKKFKKDFNMTPFTPESYKAELVDDKWSWGKISSAGINGCSAFVTFNKDGSDETVKVAYHTDILKNEPDLKKVPIKIDKVVVPDNFPKIRKEDIKDKSER